jgi:hypothetical protein
MLEMTNVSFIEDSLDTRQIKRLETYRRGLGLERNPGIFDDRVRDVLRRYEKPSCRGLVKEVNQMVDAKIDDQGRHFSRSYYDPREIEKALERFQSDHTPSRRWNPAYQEAKRRLVDWAKLHDVKMLRWDSDRDIIQALPKRDTHSGFTYIESGRKFKGENMVDVKRGLDQFVSKAKAAGRIGRPMLIGSRTQGNAGINDDGTYSDGFKLKTRLVLMVDLYQILCELKFSKPVQEAFSQWREYAGGKSRNEQAIIIGDMRSNYGYAVSLDYSSYDQSLPSWLIEDAFDIIKIMFRNDGSFDEELWNLMVAAFIHKDIIWKDGVVHCDHGVPSGSMWTQIIDSLCNKLMIETAFNVIKGGRHQCFIMGDDNLIYHTADCDVNRLLEVVQYMFGVKVNKSKSAQFVRFQDPEFLSCYWRRNGEQWRQPKVLIDHLLWPERHRNYMGSSTPELVVYSYILCYRAGMKEFLDIERFLMDNKLREADVLDAPAGTLPGFLEFRRRERDLGAVIA